MLFLNLELLLMINLLDEINELSDKYNFNLNDVVFVVEGNVIENNDFLEKYDVFYDNDFGSCHLANIQIIIDDYSWFERTSYDGCEKFVLKAHPLLSTYENQESHTEYFYR